MAWPRREKPIGWRWARVNPHRTRGHVTGDAGGRPGFEPGNDVNMGMQRLANGA
ncbi:hypothetical protein L209DRAFT_377499 [Thermothelomyces heterothallicus CBS 203.75]